MEPNGEFQSIHRQGYCKQAERDELDPGPALPKQSTVIPCCGCGFGLHFSTWPRQKTQPYLLFMRHCPTNHGICYSPCDAGVTEELLF